MQSPTSIIIDTHEGLREIFAQWDALLAESGRRNFFLSPDWIDTWLDIFWESDASLAVIAVQSAGKLVGLFPLYISIMNQALGAKCLRLLGTGEPEPDCVCTEYPDLLCYPGYEDVVARTVARVMVWDLSWDLASFGVVLPDSLICTVLYRELEQYGIAMRERPGGVRYYINLPQSWDEYLSGLSKNMRGKIRYQRRRLARYGHIREYRIDEKAQLGKALRDLVQLHSERWRAKGEQGAFHSNRFREFHSRYMSRIFPKHRLNLRVLELDGTPIGVVYNIRYQGIDSYYQSGISMSLGDKAISPGIVALSHAIQSAIEDGMEVFDFMKSGPVSYKRHYGCTMQQVHDIQFFNRTHRGRLLGYSYRAWDWLRNRSSFPVDG